MKTRDTLIKQILAHLNGELTETELVGWAEDTWVTLVETDIDEPDEAVLLDILGYIGAGDTSGFPLTWTTLSGFLEQLGVKVRVVTE